VPGGRPIGLAIAAGSLWLLDQGVGQLLRLDLVDGRQLATIAVPASSTFLVAAAGALYVASPLTGSIVRVEPATGTATTLRPDTNPDGHIDALGGSPDGLVLGSRIDVFRLDPVTAALMEGATAGRYVDAVGLDGPTILVLTEDGTLAEAHLP
jgi:sugar lactone lactonase YvrE